MVVVIAEAVFAGIRKVKRDRDISKLRGFFKNLEASITCIRGSIGGMTYGDMKRLASFKSGLRNARRLVAYSEYLRGSQKFELMWMLEEMLNMMDYVSSKPHILKPGFYEMFFGDLKRLRWLKL